MTMLPNLLNSGKLGPRRPFAKSRPVHHFVPRLIEARIAQGLTTEKLAHRLGYSACSISLWERGLRVPTLFIMQDWAQSLGFEFSMISLSEKVERAERADG